MTSDLLALLARANLVAAVAILVVLALRAWIFAHAAHGARARAWKPHAPLFGRIRQSDLARQSAPIGKSTNPGIAITRIVRGHILRPLARERTDKAALVFEVIAAIMELRPVTVPRQRYIGGMAVHAGGGEDVRACHSHALRFMDGRRIAMIDMGIILEVERNAAPVIETDGQVLGADLLDLA